MIAAMTSEAIPSARAKPVARMTAPAIAVSTKASRSVTRCWKLPSMFIDSRFAFASCQVASRFTPIPASATIRIARPPGDGGEIRRRTPSKTIRPAEEQQRVAVRLGRQDLGAPEAEGEVALRGPGDQADRDQRDEQRGGVGQHVRGVGEQGQRVDDDPDRDLGRHERDDQARARSRAASRRVPRDVHVRVRVSVRAHTRSTETSGDRRQARDRATAPGWNRWASCRTPSASRGAGRE